MHPSKLKVTWRDSYASLEETPSDDYVFETVGYFHDEDKNYLRLSMNLLLKDNKTTSPLMCINKKWILKIKIIKRA